ncbi:hypothetical protein pdam_00023382 [Pocillopora damicornis]|uniref:Uncharacterized protein n=1 Tax=Pocillopora damicornis TaxID=46731 RepID=A0A3M6TQP6_POCDA|nr:hypothetical protein pdam_00023382 [Pocillopora damicornis]
MFPNHGAADISATHLDPPDQSTYSEVHVEPVSSHPGWTEGADTGSHAVALFGDHLQQAAFVSAAAEYVRARSYHISASTITFILKAIVYQEQCAFGMMRKITGAKELLNFQIPQVCVKSKKVKDHMILENSTHTTVVCFNVIKDCVQDKNLEDPADMEPEMCIVDDGAASGSEALRLQPSRGVPPEVLSVLETILWVRNLARFSGNKFGHSPSAKNTMFINLQLLPLSPEVGNSKVSILKLTTTQFNPMCLVIKSDYVEMINKELPNRLKDAEDLSDKQVKWDWLKFKIKTSSIAYSKKTIKRSKKQRRRP